jgi:hypothetical protein
MQVKSPSGISAVTFCRLLPRAPMTVSVFPFCGARRPRGSGIWRSPERVAPATRQPSQQLSKIDIAYQAARPAVRDTRAVASLEQTQPMALYDSALNVEFGAHGFAVPA